MANIDFKKLKTDFTHKKVLENDAEMAYSWE